MQLYRTDRIPVELYYYYGVHGSSYVVCGRAYISTGLVCTSTDNYISVVNYAAAVSG